MGLLRSKDLLVISYQIANYLMNLVINSIRYSIKGKKKKITLKKMKLIFPPS